MGGEIVPFNPPPLDSLDESSFTPPPIDSLEDEPLRAGSLTYAPAKIPRSSEELGAMNAASGLNKSEDAQFEPMGAFEVAGRLAKGAVEDVATTGSAALDLLKRPSDSRISSIFTENVPKAKETLGRFGGNLTAAAKGEPTPVETAVSDIAQEAPVAATVAKMSEGFASSLPLMAAGLPAGNVGKVILGKFLYDMTKSGSESAGNLYAELQKPSEERDLDKMTTWISDLGQTALFAPLITVHASKTAKGDAIRELAGQLKSTPDFKPLETESIVQPVEGKVPVDQTLSGGLKVENIPVKETAPMMPNGWPDVKRGETVYVDGKPVKVEGISNSGKVWTSNPETGMHDVEITGKYSKEPPKEVLAPATKSAVEEVVKPEVSKSEEILLGLNRPELVDDSLKVLSEDEFRKHYLDAKKKVNEAEKFFDEVESPDELNPEQRQKIADAQDLWSAADNERFRRNNEDTHTEDIFGKMIDLADVGHDFQKFKILADILKQRGGVKESDVVGVYRLLPERITSNPDFKEALGGKLGKFKQWLERLKPDSKTIQSGLNKPASERTPEEQSAVEANKKVSLNLAEQGMKELEEINKSNQDAKPSTPQKFRVGNNPTEPEIIGMGGAIPAEFASNPQTPTSIKNAQVDVERAKRGLPAVIEPAKRSFGKVWDEAMARIDSDPGYPERLIDELRDKPRALTDLEDATLLHRQIHLQNEYGKATRDLAQAFDDSKEFPNRLDDVANEKARVAQISDQLLDLYNIGKKVGTETGRGLNARKMMAFEDYTLAKMEMQKRVEKGGAPLTDAERSEVASLHKRIEETQKAYDDYVSKTDAKIAEMEVKAALDKIALEGKESTASPYIISVAEKIVAGLDKRADAARQRIKERGFRFSSGIDPTVLLDVAEIGASHIGHVGLDFAKWSLKMVEDFGEGVKPHLETIFKASQKVIDDLKAEPKAKRRVKKEAVDEIAKAKETLMERFKSGEKDTITGTVQKLARLFVEQGIKEREPLIDAVHEALKEIDPETTRRETMDAISGYGDFKQLTKDEISVRLRGMKGEMQQIAKLEDMAAGIPPSKTGIERRTPTDEERQLIKAVNEAKIKFQVPMTDPLTQLKSALDTRKTQLENQRKDYERRLAEKDFEKKEKRIIQFDDKANQLHYEAMKAKAAWHEAMMNDRLAKRSTAAKIFAGMGETLNTARAILTSADLSAVLRQGGFIAFAHPIRAAQSFPAMFKAFRSEAGQHAIDQEILRRKNYPLYTQGKLYLSEHGHKLSQMEEAYMSRWADKIPLVAGSQRAYVTFLNKLRADSFDAMARALGRDSELTPTEVNAIANFVNVATGRGSLGMKENALVGLNTVFFAPRYVASRFQLLAGQPMYRGSLRTRTLVAKEYGRLLTGLAIVYGLAKMSGAEVETDPRSADFGKIRFGNTRVDPLFGLAQSTTFLSRMIGGKTKKLSGQIAPAKSTDVAGAFLRNKLTPVLGGGLDVRDILTGQKTPPGHSQTIPDVLIGQVVPLSMQDIYKTMLEQGVPAGTAFGVLSIFGMGLQNYEEKKDKPTPQPVNPFK